jgi:hypothetical protein
MAMRLRRTEHDRVVTLGLGQNLWGSGARAESAEVVLYKSRVQRSQALLDRDQFLEHQLKLEPVLLLIQEQIGLR